MEDNVRDIIISAVKKARKEPYVVQEFFVNDFKLMIHWDDRQGWFECCLHWSPKGSSYYNYGRTKSDLMCEVEERMREFGNKGKYKPSKLCISN